MRRAQRAVLHRKLHLHKGAQSDPLHAIGVHVQKAVDDAVLTIAADPMLADYSKTDASGYIRTWIDTYSQFLANPAAIPDFFYARYGYAVETIATRLLRSLNITPLKFQFQVTHGHTRPDVVVLDGSTEVAWIDLTSEASKGHIHRKQGGGWWARSYVAEACYEMPLPAALALGAKSLDEDTRKRLAAASQHAAEQEARFEIGRQEIGVEIAAALESAFTAWGQLSKATAKQVILDVARQQLGDDMTASLTKSVLVMLDEIQIGSESASGASWAGWAFAEKITTGPAKERLIAYGRKVSAGEKPATTKPTAASRIRKQRGTRARDVNTTTRSGGIAKPKHKQKQKVREKIERKRNPRKVRTSKRGS